MVIANPIYDVVFKRMMENERVAKFFIGTLLDEVIENVEVKPQEFTYTDKLSAIAVFRLDFIATIKTDSGELKKVLIEIQKAKNHVDLMRFRNYFAEQYKKEDTINNVQVILPITTIYILGFDLPEIQTPCVKIERSYKDLVFKKILETTSEFVETLTHDSYIVQVKRVTERYQTRLDKLLSVFEQTNFVDENHIVKDYKYAVDIEEVKIMTEILHYTGTDPEQKKQIEIEQEAWRTVDALTGGLKRKIEEKVRELQVQRKEIETNKKEIETNKKEIETNKKEIENKNKELEIAHKQIQELLKKFQQNP